MPTNTLPIFTANSSADPSEPAFVVSYPHEGVTYVVGFDSFNGLLHDLTSYKDADGNYLDGEVINRMVDFAEESMEWSQPEYPLFAPPDAVTSRTAVSAPDSHEYSAIPGSFDDVEPEPCRCDACTQGHNALLMSRQMSDLRSTVRSQWWFVGVSLVVIGLVAWCV